MYSKLLLVICVFSYSRSFIKLNFVWISRKQNPKHERRHERKRQKKNISFVFCLCWCDNCVSSITIYSTTRDAIHSKYFASLFYGFCVVVCFISHIYTLVNLPNSYSNYLAARKKKSFRKFLMCADCCIKRGRHHFFIYIFFFSCRMEIMNSK